MSRDPLDGAAKRPEVARPPRRIFRRVLSLLTLLLVGYSSITFTQVWWASRNREPMPASAAIVLGAAQYNGTPSPVLQGRLDRAALLYTSDLVEIVVVTGGGRDGDSTTQAKAAYDYLRTVAGISDDRLRLEVDGTSTFEELAATARFLQQEGITEVTLVTDPYHARRALLVAREVGLDASVSTTDAGAPLSRLLRETLAVGAGQIIGFRRLERLAS